MHHPKAALERLYLPRKLGGRGLLDLTILCNSQIKSLKKYFLHKSDTSNLHTAIVKSDQSYTPLNLANPDNMPTIKGIDYRTQSWRQKQLHGRFPHSLEKENLVTYAQGGMGGSRGPRKLTVGSFDSAQQAQLLGKSG
jgi:hypothetical protein